MEKETIKILMVEDNPIDAQIAKRMIAKDSAYEYEVEVAGSGEEALETIEKKAFDMILLDYNLPKKSGLDTFKAIKEKRINTPVVMITGQGDENVAVQAMKEGAYDYLTKRENYAESIPIIVKKTISEYRARLERERLQKEIALKNVELERANEVLKKLDQMKSDFVANVSHELKTPLTIVKGNLDNIYKGLAGEITPTQKEILEDSTRVINRLARLVSDLLDISKIESGKMELRKEEADFIEISEEVLKSFDKLFKEKNINLKREYAGNLPKIFVDRDKITQVMINLLSNAIKFCEPNSEIGVRILNLQEEIQVEVWDTGPGIVPDELDKIFDKFVRVVKEKREGTGLGLPIVKDIVELHKGRMQAESQPGKGSRFIFTLPKTRIK